MSEEAYLSFGSNLGDRELNIRKAIGLLSRHPRVRMERISGLYETDPLYLTEQPRFLNCVVRIRTGLPPGGLLRLCALIERKLGRRRRARFGPRVIDLDVIGFGRRVIMTAGLQIPHPRMTERRFVLEPLAELSPRWKHPALGKSLRQLLKEAPGGQKVRYLKSLATKTRKNQPARCGHE